MTKSIVMIHGMWGGSWCWDNYRGFFEQQGFRCHTPVLRHHDVSPLDTPSTALGRVSLQDYADDLEMHLREMDGKPILMEHSMGGCFTFGGQAASMISRIFCERASSVKGF